jgi:hypothetical protein
MIIRIPLMVLNEIRRHVIQYGTENRTALDKGKRLLSISG